MLSQSPTIRSRALRLAALAAVPALLASALAPAALGQVDPVRPQVEPVQRADEPALEQPQNDEFVGADAYNVEVGAIVTTHYFFRGYLQENEGLIVQPFAEVGIGILSSENRGFSVDAFLGIWNSFHSEETGGTNEGASYWFESDLYGGVSVTTGNFEVGGVYTFYTYPNGAASVIQEVGAFAAYEFDLGDGLADGDDESTFQPSLAVGAGVYYEVKDYAAEEIFDTASGTTFSNPFAAEGFYLELNVQPGFEVEVGDTPLSLTFPVVVGIGLSDYYFDSADAAALANGDPVGEDEFLGFVSVAAQLGIPVPLPDRYGTWTLVGGIEGIFLGADTLQELNSGDDVELVGSAGLAISF